MKNITRVLFLFVIFTGSMFAQYTVSGKITDAQTGSPIPGANVYIQALNTGAATDANGMYEIMAVPEGTYEIRASFVGFVTMVENISVTSDLTKNFRLREKAVLLGETVVQATKARLRETPVAFSEVEGRELEFKLSSRDVPNILETTPGVYATQQGGGAGDTRLHVRGFDQRNTAIMINGVPVNDMENGWVYWSNWSGLGDVTQSIQVQRGLGASPYSVSAIGGVINVVTASAASNSQEFAKLKTEFGSDNLEKYTASFSTKISENIGLTALVSRKTWDGYADQTWLDEFTYFFSLGGVFGDHSLELQGVGSPQEHGQRTSNFSINDWNAYGFDYNADWGYLRGEKINERLNFYHKPAFNLNWNWAINKQTTLSNIFYFSFGTGGGTGPLGSGAYYGYVTEDGQRDLDAIWAVNSSNIDATYSASEARSTMALRASRNNHDWYGILSTLKHDLNDNLTLNVGIDGRYYKGEHFRTVENLLGGDYYVDNSNKNDITNIQKMKTVGDKVAYYNDGLVRQYGGFAQAEFTEDQLSLFFNVSASNTEYKRIDYFNFLESDPDRETDWESFFGYTAKAGVNFNIDQYNNVFANVGYFSKAPIFDNVFDFVNNKYEDPENEKILGFEVGYGINTSQFALLANAYMTTWSDRAISRSFTDTTGTEYYYNITGAKQEHKGIELEMRWKPNRKLELNGHLGYADNKYGENVESRKTSELDPTTEDVFVSYVDGLNVGDFPQTTASLGFNYRVELNNGAALTFNPVYKFFGRQYANFDPDGRTNEADDMDSWRMPDYYLIDIHVGYEALFTDFIFKKLTVTGHLFNALNTIDYITDARDGNAHNAETARVWYGRDRWFNFSVQFDF